MANNNNKNSSSSSKKKPATTTTTTTTTPTTTPDTPTFFQANIKTSKTVKETITITPTFNIKGTSFQGSSVKFAKGWPSHVTMSSIAHTSSLNIDLGDVFTVNLGLDAIPEADGQVTSMQGPNVVEISI